MHLRHVSVEGSNQNLVTSFEIQFFNPFKTVVGLNHDTPTSVVAVLFFFSELYRAINNDVIMVSRVLFCF